MHFCIFLTLHTAVILLCVSKFLSAYDYEEIGKWNATCAPRDTCSIPRDLDETRKHNCDCSSLCVLYNSCCIDSPFLNISRKYERSASCRPAGQSGRSVFMIDQCLATYKGSVAIRRRCEQTAKNWSDPFNNLPVTNKKSLKTYKSLFCALCNDEDVQELEMWQVKLDCSELTEYMEVCTKNRDFVLNNMIYIQEKGVWGLWSWDSKTDWKFRYLPMSYEIPSHLQTIVKECRPKLISECPPRWRNTKTNCLCQAYMGALYFRDFAFRNVHCAVCNGITSFTNETCIDNINAAFKGTTMSFGLLLDIDLRHGNKVGNVEKKCSSNEVYDPFARKCRKIECPIPGFSLKDGRCVAD